MHSVHRSHVSKYGMKRKYHVRKGNALLVFIELRKTRTTTTTTTKTRRTKFIEFNGLHTILYWYLWSLLCIDNIFTIFLIRCVWKCCVIFSQLKKKKLLLLSRSVVLLFVICVLQTPKYKGINASSRLVSSVCFSIYSHWSICLFVCLFDCLLLFIVVVVFACTSRSVCLNKTVSCIVIGYWRDYLACYMDDGGVLINIHFMYEMHASIKYFVVNRLV